MTPHKIDDICYVIM